MLLRINVLRPKSTVFVASGRNASMHRVVIVLGIGGAPAKVFFPPLESDGWANPTGRLQCKNRAYRVPESCLGLGYPQPAASQQPRPRTASMPSFAMIGTITNPATGSAHHQPK